MTDANPAGCPASDPADHLARISDMLMDQAQSLDAIFAEMAAIAADRVVDWPGTARDYAMVALRAQSNCRSSLEAVARVNRATRSLPAEPNG